jgi:hypothetical protein
VNDEITAILAAWHSEIAGEIRDTEATLRLARAQLADAELADAAERRRIAGLDAAFVAIVPKDGIPASLRERMRPILVDRNPGALIRARAAVETAQRQLDDLRTAENCLARTLAPPPPPAPALTIVQGGAEDLPSPVAWRGAGFGGVAA